jgi:HlyD family secretion protein
MSSPSRPNSRCSSTLRQPDSTERGQLTAQIAQANSRIAETEFQIVQIDQDLRTEIVRDLRETQAKESELIERRIAAEDQLKRVEICSP